MNVAKTAWHHLRRSPFQSLAAVLVMTVSFFCLSLFLFINDGMSSVLGYFETKPEITIFLKDGLDRTTVENVQKELMNFPEIREIRFISKEEALNIYKEQNKDNPLLTEMVTSSILPASFEVSVSDPKILEQIAQNFNSKSTVVDEIIYQKDIINSILSWTSAIRKIGIASVIILSLVSILIIFSIIGLKINNRKDEIKISRLLGASKFYVKKPFLIEGAFYGIVGSFLGSIFILISILYFKSHINGFFQPISFIRSNIGFYLIAFLSELTLGFLLGLFTSWISVRRYIKF